MYTTYDEWEATMEKKWKRHLAQFEYNRKYKEKTMEWFKNYKKTLKCIKCGEDNPACLDFHHRDSSKKEHSVSHVVTYSIQRLKKEISKCDVLCANCHRKLHA